MNFCEWSKKFRTKKPHACSHFAVRISLPDCKKMYLAFLFPKSNMVCHVNLVLSELFSVRPL